MRRVMIFLLLVSGLAWAAPDPYLIIPGQGFGKFKASLGLAALEKLTPPGVFGSGEEGSAQIEMIEPIKRIDVRYDAKKRVKAMEIHGYESKWHTREGLTLGTTLVALEKINGKPFKFRSFEGDHGGQVTDWGAGKMAPGRLKVTFASPMHSKGYGALSGPEKEAIEQPHIYSSADSVAHRLNPIVETITLEF